MPLRRRHRRGPARPLAAGWLVLAATLAAVLGTGPAPATAAADPAVRDGAGRVRLLAADGRRVTLAGVARVFGVAARTLRPAATSEVAGRQVLRLQQTVAGIPVLGGQLVTVRASGGGLLSATGEVSHASGRPAYVVPASTAAGTARRVLSRRLRVPVSSLSADRPTRWLLDRSLLDPRARPGLRSVWQVPVSSSRRPDLRQLVLVDARSGRVAMRLDAAPALDRVVCDDVRSTSYRCRPGGYDRVEGGAPTGIADADQAYDLTGATATWYAGHLGVDLTAVLGTDLGDGPKLRSTTNYCPPGSCPLDNAFWSGDQMVYGAGYTSADDVVAHELTHGVTQHTAGLVYWYQSGAINESMSDVFGELVDLGDGVGNDAPDVRWVLGEDLPARAGGAARDMADPPRFGQPDTTSSPLYDQATDYDDNGAVHTDSGVPNKTAYLIADGTVGEPGGAFHGRAFAGIGTDRTASLYWATLQMLTPGSDFVDLALALRQACVNLAFGPAECTVVGAAVDATELGRWTGPSAPRSVSIAGGPGLVHLSWLPPAPGGSAPLGSYVVAVSPPVRGDDFYVIDPGATGWDLTGLAAGVDYTVALVAVTALGTSPPVSRTLTGTIVAAVAPASVEWGSRLRVVGALRGSTGTGLAGRRVQLMRRDHGSHRFALADTVTTAADGSFALSWVGRTGSAWYLLHPGGGGEIGVRSPRRTAAVRPPMTLTADDLSVRPGRVVTLSGRVRGGVTGRVVVQRRYPGGWRPVGRAVLAGGRWSLSWRVPSERPTLLRARVSARPGLGLAPGTSRTLLLNGSRGVI